MVPVLRNVQEMNFAVIEKEIHSLGVKVSKSHIVASLPAICILYYYYYIVILSYLCTSIVISIDVSRQLLSLFNSRLRMVSSPLRIWTEAPSQYPMEACLGPSMAHP